MQTTTSPRIETDLPLRQVIFEDFKSLPSELPIHGGWGYSMEDAIVIDKNDPVVKPGLPFDGVAIEYIIVEKRIFEELIVFQPQGVKFKNIRWRLKEQRLEKNSPLTYDHLIFEVDAVHETSLEHYTYEAQYWFEISSFYE
jgi:hypothetical protein